MRYEDMNGAQKAGWWTGKIFRGIPIFCLSVAWWCRFIVSLINVIGGM